MKKLVSMVMVAALTLAMLAGCGNSSGISDSSGGSTPANEENAQVSEDNTEAAEKVETDSAYPTGEELKEEYGFKMGFMFTSFSDALGKRFRKVTEDTCEMLGVEPVFSEFGLDFENMISVTQNQIEMGCDGVLAAGGYAELFKLCEENEVIQMYASNMITDPDLNELAANMDYFGGIVCEDDYNTAVSAVETLYEAGCRKIGLLGMTPGLGEAFDNRTRGVKDAIDAHEDMELIVDFYGMPGEYGEALTQWLTIYPEMDGVVQCSNDGTGEAAIYSEGAEERVKLAVFDLQDGTGDAIRDGVVVWCATGQENTWVISIILAYNQLLGYDLIEDNTMELTRPFLQIKSPEEYDVYLEYVDGDIPVYNEEEVKSLIKAWNPDVTLEDIIALNENYSIEDIARRRGVDL